MNSRASQELKRERWYESKRFRRFRRNPLALAGLLILLFFAGMALLAPVLTADRLPRGCMRDLSLGRSEARQALRNPARPAFWRAAFAPPKSCYKIPRVSYSPVPKPPSARYPLGIASGGYDIYYGIVWGARTSFYIGVLVVVSCW